MKTTRKLAAVGCGLALLFSLTGMVTPTSAAPPPLVDQMYVSLLAPCGTAATSLLSSGVHQSQDIKLHGVCAIPAAAVAVNVEVLASGATSSGVVQGSASSASAAATVVTYGLGRDNVNTTDIKLCMTCVAGKDIKLTNFGAGTVNVTVTVNGYYMPIDGSALAARVKALEDTVGDATKGLVKDVNSLKTTVGDATTGLVKDVNALKTTVGDVTTGLVKDVNALKAADTAINARIDNRAVAGTVPKGGTTTQSQNIVSSTDAAGTFTVTFDRNVDNCTFTVSAQQFPAATYFVFPGAHAGTDLTVQETDVNGNAMDQIGFTVTGVCAA